MVPFAVLLPWLHRKAGSWHRARGVCGRSAGHRRGRAAVDAGTRFANFW